jgi:ubiquinone biosynthesis protein COQ9
LFLLLFLFLINNKIMQRVRAKILSAAIPFVNENGWGARAMAEASHKIGLPPTAHGMFKNPEADLVRYFMDECNKELAMELDERKHFWEKDGTTSMERYTKAIRLRLNMVAPYIKTQRWHEAMSIGALPSNASITASQLYDLTEEICSAAATGESSSKSSSNPIAVYGERSAICSVYIATELFMLTDDSENFRDTWDFLDSRLKELEILGGVTKPDNFSDGAFAAMSAATAFSGAALSLLRPVGFSIFANGSKTASSASAAAHALFPK